MCCFSGPVKNVGKTSIFARAELGAARQQIAYSMSFSASEPLAMILPIPVLEGSVEDAVRFIDLSAYPTFFADLDRAFPTVPTARGPVAAGAARPQLIVHEVGHLEASFVPTTNDFDRLDSRFRLPSAVWDQLPEQRSYGFVVVKLAASASAQNVHPIAFDFARRDRARIFFPTLHVHDRAVHATAAFDHTLYAQGAFPAADWWTASSASLGQRIDSKRAQGLVDDAPAWKLNIFGERSNADIWV
jgi:hypothetical protein